jgi:diacylglycerol kinase (ATP)
VRYDDPRPRRAPIADSPGTRSLTFTGRVRSFSYAIRGIALMLRSQQNAWIHAAATVVVVGAGLLVRLTRAEWSWIVLAILVVWTAEALNTAIEFLTDVASPDFHPLAGQAKDVAAGAVLIAAIGAVVVALLVFVPHVAGWLGMRATQ